MYVMPSCSCYPRLYGTPITVFHVENLCVSREMESGRLNSSNTCTKQPWAPHVPSSEHRPRSPWITRLVAGSRSCGGKHKKSRKSSSDSILPLLCGLAPHLRQGHKWEPFQAAARPINRFRRLHADCTETLAWRTRALQIRTRSRRPSRCGS
jgi:hypothetical protein